MSADEHQVLTEVLRLLERNRYDAMQEARLEVERLLARLGDRRLEELEAENARLMKENAGLWESVHERDDLITELRATAERAHAA